MADRPILFSAPMVRALLAGTKTQTRRIVKPHPDKDMGPRCVLQPHELAGEVNGGNYRNSRYGQPGDRLWVRETFCTMVVNDWPNPVGPIGYRADGHLEHNPGVWRPSIHMARRHSRITLEITAVRVERLHNISRGDAMAEGCPFPNMAKGDDPRDWYCQLWRDINGRDSWDANPWVWIVEFRRAADTTPHPPQEPR